MNINRTSKRKSFTIFAIFFAIVMLVYGCSVVYCAINSTMLITGDAIARIDKNIRITGVKLSSVKNNGLELYSPEYSVNTITTGVSLSNLNSEVNYQITVVNSGSEDMVISDIYKQTNSNNDIVFESDYETYTKIDAGSTLTINFTYKYKSSVTTVPSYTKLECSIYFEFDVMPAPVLASQNSWYKGTTERSLITSISIADKYEVPSDKTVIESWDASDGSKKSVTAYVLDDYSLVLSGNGEGNGKVIANIDSSSSFGSIYSTASFINCLTFDVSLLDTSNVTNMESMFEYVGYSASGTVIRGLENFDVSNVTNMSKLFAYVGRDSTSLNIDGIDDWDVSSVTDMTQMFSGVGTSATSWNIGNLSNWNIDKVTNLYSMFEDSCYTASDCDIGNLDNWNTADVTATAYMFSSFGYNATNLNIGDLSGWNVSNVKNMSYMFSNCGRKDTTWSVGKLADWDTGSVTNMSRMFYSAGYKSTSFSLDLSNWNVSNVTNLSSFLSNSGEYSKSWTAGDLSNWDVSKVTNMGSAFAVTGYMSTNGCDLGDLSGWDVSNVTNMGSIFFYAGYTYGFRSFDMSNWNVSKVTSLSGAFMAHDNLENYHIENWDVSNVTSMARTFKDTTFDSLNLSNWDVSKVTSMEGMFSYSSGKNLDISGWNTSKVTNMYEMFYDCDFLEIIYIGSGWDTSNVTNSTDMFYNAILLPNFDSTVIDKTNAHGDTGGYMNRVTSFTVDGVRFRAPVGITWFDWLETEDGKNSGLKSWGYCIGTTDFNYYLSRGSTMVFPDHVIYDGSYQLLVN